jgi:hypothetical protein
MPLGHLLGFFTPHAVDAAPALHRRARRDGRGPTLHVGVFVHRKEFTRVVGLAFHHQAVPGVNGDVGNAVVVTRHVGPLGQVAVQHVELALDLHGEAVDGVFELLGRVGVKVAETTAQVGRRTHLPEQPIERFGARGGALGQQGTKLFGQIQQDGAGLKHARGRLGAAVEQGRNFGVGVDRHKTAGELVAIADFDEPAVVFGAGVAQGEQLFEHHRDLHAVGRGHGIQLQRVLAHRQGFVVRGAGNGAVDVGKLAAVGLVPSPDGGRCVGGFVGHG